MKEKKNMYMEYEISIRYKLKGVQTIIYKTVIE